MGTPRSSNLKANASRSIRNVRVCTVYVHAGFKFGQHRNNPSLLFSPSRSVRMRDVNQHGGDQYTHTTARTRVWPTEPIPRPAAQATTSPFRRKGRKSRWGSRRKRGRAYGCAEQGSVSNRGSGDGHSNEAASRTGPRTGAATPTVSRVRERECDNTRWLWVPGASGLSRPGG